MGYLIMALQLILSLSILVTLHELGHFWPARKFGMRVEKFYLFFDAWFSLYKVKRGDTEYGIGWLPLGGYVKIAGMVDESMDTEQLNKPAEEWEFRAKPAWQRLIVMLGGVTVNFVLGFFLLGMLLWVYGEEFLPTQNATDGVQVSTVGAKLGLQDGDKVLAVGDKKLQKVNGAVVSTEILLNGANTIKVERAGSELTLNLSDEMIAEVSGKDPLYAVRFPFVASKVLKDNPAATAGLVAGDSIIACNNKSTPFFNDFLTEISKFKDTTVIVSYVRQGEIKQANIHTTAEGRIGVEPYMPNRYYSFERKKYSFFAAMPMGVTRGVDFVVKNIKAFGEMFGGRIKATESLGGFVSIAKLFPPQWNWERFWHMTAILSLILGFMNLLPIPALDGGHAVFLLYEIVARRPVPQKVLEYAQVVGFVLLMSLLLFANGNDIYQNFCK